uniref:Uncharacterized protein n=1 Tax=Oryza rufipogon TaxID=4529 RepID=A0A0E0NGM8_ORYRU
MLYRGRLGLPRRHHPLPSSLAGFREEISGRRGGGDPTQHEGVWRRVEGAGGGVKWQSCQWQDWKSAGEGAPVRCDGGHMLPMLGWWYQSWRATDHNNGVESPRRKPSPVFHWTGSGYAFGRGNPLGGVVEVPSSLDEDLQVKPCPDFWTDNGGIF